MKNLVLTITSGDRFKAMSEITHPSIKNYAKKIDAEFMIIDNESHWGKCQIYYLLNHYDRIIYFDTDLIIRDDCPDLLDIVPVDSLGAFNEGQFGSRELSMYETCKAYNVKLKGWKGTYYNTGVMVISKQHKQIFKKPDILFDSFFEQGYLNMRIAQESPKIFSLPYWFNRMSCVDMTGQDRHASYIIHYAGHPFPDMVNDVIRKDLARWDKDKPSYEYKYHIIIDVQGGLGDQVDAEPSIRFMINNVYKGQDIQIKTHFPELFDHLGIPIYNHSDWIPQHDTPYYHVVTLPGTETLQWSIVSNLLCHTVDFISMAMLRRILPLADKQVKLAYSLDDLSAVIDVTGLQNLNNLVLVHPGRHWQSKTFPQGWWQTVIDGLSEAGLKVCLIGKEDGDRGTVAIETGQGIIDTRDRLSLKELIALIASAGMLISNDSAPIHIAGAFDNNIIVIPTCKHPEHILPYRNGSIWHKARALYESLPIDEFDTRPTTVHGASGEFTMRDIIEYLPNPEDILASVLEMMD